MECFHSPSFPHSSPLSCTLPPITIVLQSRIIKGIARERKKDRKKEGRRAGWDWRLIDWGWLGKGVERWGWGGGEGCWQAGEGQIKGREEGQKEKVAEPKLATLPQLLKSYFVTGRLWQTEEAKGETTVEERARDHDWMAAVEWVFKAACEFFELPWALGGRSSGTAESQKKDKIHEETIRTSDEK